MRQISKQSYLSTGMGLMGYKQPKWCGTLCKTKVDNNSTFSQLLSVWESQHKVSSLSERSVQWLIPAMTFFDYSLISLNSNGPKSEGTSYWESL